MGSTLPQVMLGQQVVVSTAPKTGHAQAGIMGQLTGVALAEQTGHFSMGQQVVGSVPAGTGA